jgi:uncharacterized protein (DUF342 family)
MSRRAGEGGFCTEEKFEGMICSTEALEILERSHRKDANEDSRLLELENEIFELKEEIEKFHPELSRLQEIWD